jgi:hypothetical protein
MRLGQGGSERRARVARRHGEKGDAVNQALSPLASTLTISQADAQTYNTWAAALDR